MVKEYDFDVDLTLKEVVDETKEEMVEGNKGNICVMIAKANDNTSMNTNDVAGRRFLIFSSKEVSFNVKRRSCTVVVDACQSYSY